MALLHIIYKYKYILLWNLWMSIELLVVTYDWLLLMLLLVL